MEITRKDGTKVKLNKGKDKVKKDNPQITQQEFLDLVKKYKVEILKILNENK